MIDTFFKMYEHAFELQHTLMDEWIEGQRLWGECALNFQHKTKKQSKQSLSPLAIFSPDIMKDAYASFQDTLGQAYVQYPDDISAIYAQYATDMERLVSHIALGEGFTLHEQDPLIQESPSDRRFQHEAWSNHPYFFTIKQIYLLHTRLYEDLLDLVDRVSDAHNGLAHEKARDKWRFYAKQMIAAMAPTNFPLTNPEVMRETARTQGQNLKRGFQNFLQDLEKGYLGMTDMRAFQVGHSIASTPGDVVFENDVLQLIRYHATTPQAYAHPLVIIPAWINKFYLFDLTPETSFVRWCLERGMDVYIISWINPVKKSPSKTFCHYALDGVYQAIRYILKNSNTSKVNALGNCAGGILLNCLMAYLEAHNITSPFASATTLASPIDSNKLGDLKTFICKDQIRLLEESLDELNIIPGNLLVQSFNLLRPQELLWSFYIKHYLMGQDPEAFDILFWNCDSMNLPGRMHSQYLRNIFLDNKLMKAGAMRLGGTPIDLSAIQTPSFILGAEKDHIAPWNSVYALTHRIQSSIKEFILTGSGHVSGVMNHPARNKYQYWTNPKTPAHAHTWMKEAVAHKGSWWEYWHAWLTPFLGEMRDIPPNITSIEPAPGRYVLQKSTINRKSCV